MVKNMRFMKCMRSTCLNTKYKFFFLLIMFILASSIVEAGAPNKCDNILNHAKFVKTRLLNFLRHPIHFVQTFSEGLWGDSFLRGVNIKNTIKPSTAVNYLPKDQNVNVRTRLFHEEDEETEFYLKVAKNLNEQRHFPLNYVRYLYSSNLNLLEIVNQLEAEALKKGLSILWGGSSSYLTSQLSPNGELKIAVNDILKKVPSLGFLLVVKREISYSANSRIFSGKDMNAFAFIEKNLDMSLKDEINARLAEESVFRSLQLSGLVSEKDVEDLSLNLWKARANGASEDELLELIKKDEYLVFFITVVMEYNWEKLYQDADQLEIKEVFVNKNGLQDILAQVQSVFEASHRWKSLLKLNRPLYEEKVLIGVRNLFIAEEDWSMAGFVNSFKNRKEKLSQ